MVKRGLYSVELIANTKKQAPHVEIIINHKCSATVPNYDCIRVTKHVYVIGVLRYKSIDGGWSVIY